MVTALGGQRVNALTGAADHSRQDVQWQYPIATGFPVTSNSIAPQKQWPFDFSSFDMDQFLRQRGKNVVFRCRKLVKGTLREPP